MLPVTSVAPKMIAELRRFRQAAWISQTGLLVLLIGTWAAERPCVCSAPLVGQCLPKGA